MRWRPGAFDELLSEVADDETGSTLWMSQVNGAIFAPYDGGFDLFSRSRVEIEQMRVSHENWLSTYPGGL